MRDEIQIRCSLKFKNSVNRLYPDIKSMRVKTEKLNRLLEEMIYEIRKKRQP